MDEEAATAQNTSIKKTANIEQIQSQTLKTHPSEKQLFFCLCGRTR